MEQVVMAVIVLGVVMAIRREDIFELCWRPSNRTWAALGTGLLAWALSALLLVVRGTTARLIHYGLLYSVCGILIPWGLTLLVDREPLSTLGLRREGWRPSLWVGLALAALFSLIIVFKADPETLGLAPLVKASVVLVGAGGLFELFLYYGFIHLTLDRAFGPLPAILGTAVLYVAWHTGTQLPMEPHLGIAIVKLLAVGVMYQAIFALTHNLLIIWPFFHGAGVLIDFTVNLDALEQVSVSLPWAAGSLIAMACLAMGIWLASKRPAHPATAHSAARG